MQKNNECILALPTVIIHCEVREEIMSQIRPAHKSILPFVLNQDELPFSSQRHQIFFYKVLNHVVAKHAQGAIDKSQLETMLVKAY